MESTVNAADIPLSIKPVLWLQSRFGEESWAAWNFITELGTPPVFMVIIGFMFWQGRKSLAITALIAILIVGILVDLLKVFIAMPRPYYAFEMVAAWRDSTGFGMPSGHAAGAATLWLFLAVFVRRWWFSFIAIILILSIGVSRMYFGVHSGAQVFFGWILGVAVVFLIIYLQKFSSRWYQRTNHVVLALVAMATIVSLACLQMVIIQPMADQFTIPSLWNERFNLAVKFEDLLDGDTFKPKVLKLFDAIELAQIGTIAGVWIILYWWKINKLDAIADEPVRGLLLTLTTTLGILVIFLLVTLIELTERDPVPGFIVWASVPVLLAIVVPRTAQWILSRSR